MAYRTPLPFWIGSAAGPPAAVFQTEARFRVTAPAPQRRIGVAAPPANKVLNRR